MVPRDSIDSASPGSKPSDPSFRIHARSTFDDRSDEPGRQFRSPLSFTDVVVVVGFGVD